MTLGITARKKRATVALMTEILESIAAEGDGSGVWRREEGTE